MENPSVVGSEGLSLQDIPERTLSGMDIAALLVMPLRWVLGWLYFSAFWRRVVLENKLDPDAAGYVGEKFNHFLPQALLIGPVIEWFVSHPTALFWKLVGFTLLEAMVGIALMLGLMTRLAGLTVAGLAAGILLGAGWLGTTCLDEWQIGVMGITGGLLIAAAGGGPVSLDGMITRYRLSVGNRRWFRWVASGDLGWLHRRRWLLAGAVVGSVLCLGITLWTNQVFHGGVYGRLHNKSVAPHVTIYMARLDPSAGELRMEFLRDEGADVYGSFVIDIAVTDADGRAVAHFDGPALASLPPEAIENRYVARVTAGPHSLVLPLGARAEVRLASASLRGLSGSTYSVRLTDISGKTWEAPVRLEQAS